MRTALFAAMAAISCLCAVQPAFAGITVNTTTTTYAISGQTGYDLLKQMDRKGPKHGFLTRAIAQTRYAVKWDISWKVKGSTCRVDKVAAVLDVNYSYPRVTSRMSPALSKRWNAFMRGVRKHEEVHGALARRMVVSAESSVRNLSVKRDPNCRQARAEVKKRVNATYAKFEAQQIAFDEREHRDGGTVAELVERLVR
jgi:predicted secreted Zn-dependent protease